MQEMLLHTFGVDFSFHLLSQVLSSTPSTSTTDRASPSSQRLLVPQNSDPKESVITLESKILEAKSMDEMANIFMGVVVKRARRAEPRGP